MPAFNHVHTGGATLNYGSPFAKMCRGLWIPSFSAGRRTVHNMAGGTLHYGYVEDGKKPAVVSCSVPGLPQALSFNGERYHPPASNTGDSLFPIYTTSESDTTVLGGWYDDNYYHTAFTMVVLCNYTFQVDSGPNVAVHYGGSQNCAGLLYRTNPNTFSFYTESNNTGIERAALLSTYDPADSGTYTLLGGSYDLNKGGTYGRLNLWINGEADSFTNVASVDYASGVKFGSAQGPPSVGSSSYDASNFVGVSSPKSWDGDIAMWGFWDRYLEAEEHAELWRICQSGEWEKLVTFEEPTTKLYAYFTADSGAYSLTCDSGSYSVSGTAAALTEGYYISAVAGSYAISGTAAALNFGYTQTSDPGSYAISGTAATLTKDSLLTAVAGSYTVTGTAALFYPGSIAKPISDTSIGSWTWHTGATSNLYSTIDEDIPDDSDYIKDNDTNSTARFQLDTLTDPSIHTGHYVRFRYKKFPSGNTRELTVSLYQGTTLIAEQTDSNVSTDWTQGVFELSEAEAATITDYTDLNIRFTSGGTTGGLEAALVYVSFAQVIVPFASAYTLACDAGSYAISGTDTSLTEGYYISAEAGSYIITGTDAAEYQGRLLTAEAGSYTISGTAALLTEGYYIAADPGSYSLSGTDAGLSVDWLLALDAGSYAINGTDASLVYGDVIAIDPGAYTVTGTDAVLTVDRTTTAEAGSYVVSGTDASLLAALTLTSEAGSYDITGTAAGLAFGRMVAAATGSYSVSGTATSLLYSRVFSSAAGTYTITGTEAALRYNVVNGPGIFATGQTYRPGFKSGQVNNPGFKKGQFYKPGFKSGQINNSGFKSGQLYKPGFKSGEVK